MKLRILNCTSVEAVYTCNFIEYIKGLKRLYLSYPKDRL